MKLKNLFKSRQRLILIISASLIILFFLVSFLLARPWGLAGALRAVNELETSFNRTSPCHEPCLVARLEQERIIVLALKNKQPGLAERIKEIITDPKTKIAFRRELQRLLDKTSFNQTSND